MALDEARKRCSIAAGSTPTAAACCKINCEAELLLFIERSQNGREKTRERMKEKEKKEKRGKERMYRETERKRFREAEQRGRRINGEINGDKTV